MSSKGPFLHHSINYIEFSVLDIDASKRFYGNAFGWSFNDYGPEYSGIRNADGAGEFGGLCKATTVTAGGPLVVLYSGNLEDSATSVENAGGKISKPIFAFPGGRRFHFVDPSGNELGVWSDR